MQKFVILVSLRPTAAILGQWVHYIVVLFFTLKTLILAVYDLYTYYKVNSNFELEYHKFLHDFTTYSTDKHKLDQRLKFLHQMKVLRKVCL